MAKSLQKTLIAAIFLIFSGQALAECEMPQQPIIPDGHVASEDELVAAQKGMKAYQARLIDYRSCLGKARAELTPDAEESAAEIGTIDSNHDASVDAEQRVVDKFNASVRAFKARQ